MDTDVLIIGSGPTGLVLALWLTRLGVKVRVWEKLKAIVQTSRAVGIQARTLELYGQLGLSEKIARISHNACAMNVWVNSSRRASVPIQNIATGLTPYAGIYILPQEIHEQILEDRLGELGVKVERGVELLDYTDHDSLIIGHGQRDDGTKLECKARYIAGCDGAHSKVRASFGVTFQGGTYPEVFYVADMEGSGGALNGQMNLDLSDSDDLQLVIAYNEGTRARIFGVAASREDLKEDEREKAIYDQLAARVAKVKIEMKNLHWFSAYKVHHRVADRFRHGRAFILGDAAHIHSPVGGQGMNTGIGDSINLAWKLAAVLQGQSGEAILDTYEVERRAFAMRLVNTTDRVFTLARTSGWLAKFIRTVVIPTLVSILLRIPAVARFFFRTVSQTGLNYRSSPLSEAVSKTVSGGDRVPWIPSEHEGDDDDNYESLNAVVWQVHVYGIAKESLSQWCKMHGLSLHTFAYTHRAKSLGLGHNAAYLIRPDSYIAVVNPSGAPEMFERYLSTRGLHLSGEDPDLLEN